MLIMEKTYLNEVAGYIMGFKEAQDLFSGVGTLGINDSGLLMLAKEYNATHFWHDGEWMFADVDTARHVIKELGVEDRNDAEVTAWLIGKQTVMVKVFYTNTRPEGFTEATPISRVLELGYELGQNKEGFYLRKGGVYLKKGDEIQNESFRQCFLEGPINGLQWTVTIKKILPGKVIGHCQYVDHYPFYVG